MEKRLFRIILSTALIALLILLECSESSLKEQVLGKIGTALAANAFPVSRMSREDKLLQVVMGNPLYIQNMDMERLAESKLIYMENHGGEKTSSGEGQGANGESDLQGSADASAVAGENLAQVQTMKGAGSGTAAYVNKLRENKDVSYLWNHFYIIDSTTSVTKDLFHVEEMLKRNMTIPAKAGKKQILIYHTHGASEAFSDSRKGRDSDSVIGVGRALKQELEKNGYQVYHDETKYDLINGQIDRSKAYNTSLDGITKIMKENPDIQVTIDLHRDSVGKNKHTYTMIDGKKTAIVMFFNGMSRNKSGKIDYLYNPNLEANLSFSLQLKCHAMEQYDGFTKPIYLKGYRYNLHVAERALLVELGNENNTVEEAKNAAAPLAKVIADVLKGEVKGF
ncbi:MAG: stage II sporulation protein P [Eubacterium sp.]|nr:stage II sporulation protein P [Eubacterium sp.]